MQILNNLPNIQILNQSEHFITLRFSHFEEWHNDQIISKNITLIEFLALYECITGDEPRQPLKEITSELGDNSTKEEMIIFATEHDFELLLLKEMEKHSNKI